MLSSLSIADINIISPGSNPSPIVELNGVGYFAAEDGAFGRELWRTDGTPEGTVLLKDIYSGSQGSGPDKFVVLNGSLYFTASSATGSSCLWRTDGTAAGTVQVAALSTTAIISCGSQLFLAASGPLGNELYISDGTTAGTKIVRDINVGSSSSNIGNLLGVGNRVFFLADDGISGKELWTSDGTSGGTIRLLDAASGSASANYSYVISALGQCFFRVGSSVTGEELWASDGTLAGTHIVKDIYNKSNGSSITNAIVSGGVTYFAANDGTHGNTIWRSDGTAEGTYMLADAMSGGSWSNLQRIAISGGKIYWMCQKNNSYALWASDGTAGNGVQLPGNPDSYAAMADLNGMLYFAASDAAHGEELWRSDGTVAGTVMVADLAPGAGSSYPSNLWALNGRVVFTAANGLYSVDNATTPAPLGLSGGFANFFLLGNQLFFSSTSTACGAELYVTDGTAGGTKLVKDVNPVSLGSTPTGYVRAGQLTYFVATDEHGREVWRTDGTAQGTFSLRHGDWGSPNSLTPVGNKLFFVARGSNSDDIWVTDGTPEGTQAVITGQGYYPSLIGTAAGAFVVDGTADHKIWFTTGAGSAVTVGATTSYSPFAGVGVGTRMVFVNNDAAHGQELWVSDGTAAGTGLLCDIYAGATSSNIGSWMVTGDRAFFVATDVLHGSELWVTDGTAGGTHIVKDLNDISGDANPGTAFNLNGIGLFTASDGSASRLYRSDGTPGGTYAIAAASDADNFQAWNGLALFSATYNSYRCVWRTDGTASGTYPLTHVVLPKASNSFLYQVTPGGVFIKTDSDLVFTDGTVAGTRYLSAAANSSGFGLAGASLVYVNSDANGSELWRVDVATLQVGPLKDIYAGSSSSQISAMTTAGGAVYFAANDGVHGPELWRTDGTAGGTTLAKDLVPGSAGVNPSSLVAVGSSVIFSGRDPLLGDELFRSDGTEAGTGLLADINSAGLSSNPSAPVVVGGVSFFTATDRDHGTELWRTDGTVAGTSLVKDISPGTNSSGISSLTACGGKLFFIANDGSHGTELWVSDGTEAGTKLLIDMNAGSASGNIANMTPFNGRLYFTGYDGGALYGAELWSTDGTTAGTHIVEDFIPGPAGDGNLKVLRGPNQLLLVRGADLWASDGTGTADVLLYHFDSTNWFRTDLPAPLAGQHLTYFIAFTSATGAEPWVTDGTPAGTHLMRDLTVGTGSSTLTNMFTVGDRLFFSFNQSGQEFWASDGTAIGTINMDIFPGSGSCSPSMPVGIGGRAIFAASHPAYGQELWASDGTLAGTYMVKDIHPGSEGSAIGPMVVMGGAAYFTANDGIHGLELWRTDGTADGTTLVRDIMPGLGEGSDPSNATPADHWLYFTASAPGVGAELWRTDGTAAGTTLVRDIVPGVGGIAVTSIRPVGDSAVVMLNDQVHGMEPWFTDGTSYGTYLLNDIYTGTSGSYTYVSASAAPLVNGQRYFVASGGVWVTDGTPAGSRCFVSMADLTAAQSIYSLYGGQDGLFIIASSQLTGWGLYYAAYDGSAPQLMHQFWGNSPSSDSDVAVNSNELFFPASDDYGRELWRSDGTAAGTFRVLDINPAGDSAPNHLSVVGGKVFFSASDNRSGMELWSSDGTAGGTARIADINTTSKGSTFGASTAHANGKLFLQQTAPVSALWATDGTDAGTVAVLTWAQASLPANNVLVSSGGRVFFSAAGASTTDLWASDGTVAGTCCVSSIIGKSQLSVLQLKPFGSGVCFTVYDSTSQTTSLWISDGTTAGTRKFSGVNSIGATVGGLVYYASNNQLWRSDGTTAGTFALSPMSFVSMSFDQVSVVGDQLLISLNDGVHGSEPWISDGTVAGTHVLTDVNGITASSNPTMFAASGGWLYFIADDGVHGRSLCRSDGTAEGTSFVAALPASGMSSVVTAMLPAGNRVVFAVYTSSWQAEIGVSDGTTSGTSIIELLPGSNGSNPTNLTAVGNQVFFTATGPSGNELYVSDGTVSGTHIVKDLITGSNGSSPQYLAGLGSKLFFVASDDSGRKLWMTDGTSANTTSLLSLPANYFVSSAYSAGDRVYFLMDDGVVGEELWVTDGTTAGTHLTRDINNLSGGSSPTQPYEYQGAIYFIANRPNVGSTLFKSDGTDAGTIALATTYSSGALMVGAGSHVFAFAGDVWATDGTPAGTVVVATVGGSSYVATSTDQAVVTSTGGLFFNGRGGQVWYSDGTPTGTALWKDFNPGYGTGTTTFRMIGNRLVIFAPYGSASYKVWTSDGTTAGTVVVDGVFIAQPTILGSDGNGVSFAANDGVRGLEVYRSDGTAAGTKLVRDIADISAGSSPANYVRMGQYQFLRANDGIHGTELFVNDGSDNSFHLLMDIVPGSGTSSPSNLTVVGNQLFFTTYVNSKTWLWVSDGTAAGTKSLCDVTSVSARVFSAVGTQLFFMGDSTLWASDGNATWKIKDISGWYPDNPTNVGGTLFFTASGGPGGPGLWRSDGTDAGTYLVKSIAFASVSNFLNFNGRLLFQATTNAYGSELWISDGTADGTHLVKDINGWTKDSSPNSAVNVGGQTFFLADDGTGQGLWVAEPASGSVHRILPSVGTMTSPGSLRAGQSQLFFLANDVAHGTVLWRTDGSVAGTYVVAPYNVTNITVWGDKLLFSASTGNGAEPWISDGTVAGTMMLTDVAAGAGASNPTSFIGAGSWGFFLASVNSVWSLWKTGGTVGSTSRVKTLDGCTGVGSAVAAMGEGRIIFAASSPQTGEELWCSDGTAAGTMLLKDINQASDSSNPYGMCSLGDKAVFVGKAADTGSELWITDGTAAGTMLLKDINPGASGSSIGGLVVSNGKAYFSAMDGSWTELWVTDGTAGGTVRIDVQPNYSASPTLITPCGPGVAFVASGSDGNKSVWYSDGTLGGSHQLGGLATSAYFGSLRAVGGRIFASTYFPSSYVYSLYASDAATGSLQKLGDFPSADPCKNMVAFGSGFAFMGYNGSASLPYITDGTTAGTREITAPDGTRLLGGAELAVYNGRLFFSANADVAGDELWTSDGTSAGTFRVKDINTVSAGSKPMNYLALGNVSLFLADDGVHGVRYWRTDGTAAGTYMLSDQMGDTNVSGGRLVAYQGQRAVIATGYNNSELWITDGTVAGTSLIRKEAGYRSVSALAADTGRVFFTTDDGVHGNELWVSDGTSAGTALVTDLLQGTGGGVRGQLAVRGDVVYFAGNDGWHGWEAFRSDGTAAGTILLADINAGPLDSSPTQWTVTDGRVFFVADDGTHGGRIWSTDGTAAGTAMIADIPRNNGSTTYSLAALGSRIVFTGGSGSSSYYACDGISEPVRLPVPASSLQSSAYFTRAGGRLYFSFYATDTGSELWSTDGTPAGTGMVMEINAGSGSSSPYCLAELPAQPLGGDANGDGIVNFRDYIVLESAFGKAGQGWAGGDFDGDGTVNFKDYIILEANFGKKPAPARLLFRADDGVHGQELWVTDGSTSGTHMVKDLTPGAGNSFYSSYMPVVVGGKAYFGNGSGITVSDGTDAGTYVVTDVTGAALKAGAFSSAGSGVVFTSDDGTPEPWFTDGTTEGTRLIKPIQLRTNSSSPANFQVVGGRLLFTASTGNSSTLFGTDGTEAGTALLAGGYYLTRPMTTVGQRFFYMVEDYASDWTIWSSDGTVAGTRSLANFDEAPVAWQPVGDDLYFSVPGGAKGPEIWKSDGTPGGTVLVDRPLHVLGASVETPAKFCLVGDKIVFVADDGSSGNELFVSDGTDQGTGLLKDFSSSTYGADVENLMISEGVCYFSATANGRGYQLWRTDGTPAGTRLFADLGGKDSSSPVAPWAVIGQRVFFVGTSKLWSSDGTPEGTLSLHAIDTTYSTRAVLGQALFFTSAGQLWRTDGTSAGTICLDSLPNIGTDVVSILGVMNGRLLVNATSQTRQTTKLFQTDGTAAGTTQVSGLGSSSNWSIQPLAVNGSTFFFGGYDSLHGWELWSSDGTTSGLLKDINYVSAGSSPSAPSVVGGYAYFSANDGTNGTTLWRTDGTEDGTISLGSTSTAATSFTAFNGIAYFSPNSTYGLWRSDGTVAGTYALKAADVRSPSNLVVYNNTLYFLVRTVGSQVWQSDGTEAGTTMIGGVGATSIGNMVGCDGKLYFAGTDAAGSELWSFDLANPGVNITAPAFDIRPGTYGSGATIFGAVSNKLLITADDGRHGLEPMFILPASSSPASAMAGGLDVLAAAASARVVGPVAPASLVRKQEPVEDLLTSIVPAPLSGDFGYTRRWAQTLLRHAAQFRHVQNVDLLAAM